jgi:hypothetical protein
MRSICFCERALVIEVGGILFSFHLLCAYFSFVYCRDAHLPCAQAVMKAEQTALVQSLRGDLKNALDETEACRKRRRELEEFKGAFRLSVTFPTCVRMCINCIRSLVQLMGCHNTLVPIPRHCDFLGF